MKGRKIWGTSEDKALVPSGKAWRLGSDEATLLVTQQPLAFGDTTIPAGAYTLYMVPQETGAANFLLIRDGHILTRSLDTMAAATSSSRRRSRAPRRSSARSPS